MCLKLALSSSCLHSLNTDVVGVHCHIRQKGGFSLSCSLPLSLVPCRTKQVSSSDAVISPSERGMERQHFQRGSRQLTQPTRWGSLCAGPTPWHKNSAGYHCQGVYSECLSSSWQADEALRTRAPPAEAFNCMTHGFWQLRRVGPRMTCQAAGSP